jgi:hypothetical protein
MLSLAEACGVGHRRMEVLLPRSGGAKKTRRTIERRLRLANSVWLKQFLASSASTQAKPAFF